MAFLLGYVDDCLTWKVCAVALVQVGGKHILIPHFSAGLVLDAIEKHGITSSNMASTMVTLLLRCGSLRSPSLFVSIHISHAALQGYIGPSW